MSNEFNREYIQRYVSDPVKCDYCGQYGADAIHHIFSRKHPYTSSVYNAAFLHNQKCHLAIHGKISTRPQQEEWVKKNIIRFTKWGHQRTDDDMRFIMYFDLDNVINEI